MIFLISILRAPPISRARKRTANRFCDRFHSGGDGTAVIAGLELGSNDVADNSTGEDVGNLALEAIAHFDAQRVILRHDDQRQAVIHALSADAPGFDGLRGPVFNRNAARGLADPDDQLMMCLLFVGLKPGIQLLGDVTWQETNGIRYPMIGSGRNGSFGGAQFCNRRRRDKNSTNRR